MLFLLSVVMNYYCCVLCSNLVNVDFDQSSYRINEDAGSVELALVLSRPMSCNCYVALTASATDMTATSE